MDNPTKPTADTPTEQTAPTVTLCGRTYTARRLKLPQDFDEAEQYLRDRRQNPVAVTAPALERWKDDPVVRKELMDRLMIELKAHGQPIPPGEVAAWLDTLDGFAFSLWQLLRDGNAELKEQETVRGLLYQTIQAEGEAQVRARLKRERDAALPNKATKKGR